MKIFKTPFAATGDKIAIPTVEQPSGEVSQPTGWTPDYQLPNTDPNYKPVGRDEMNGILYEITEALGQLQQFGFADWQNITGGWPVGANVNHGGGVWQSLANANTEEPGTGSLWKPILFDNIGQATETNLGLVRIATVTLAQALVDDNSAISPAKFMAALRRGAVGPVTQSGGFPTGAILERGSNNSGHYIKMADGTLICSTSVVTGPADVTSNPTGQIFQAANPQTFTFPHPFSFLYTVVPSGAFNPMGQPNPGSSRGWASVAAYNLTSCTIMVHASTADGAAYAGYLAIGRWFGSPDTD